MLTKIFKNLFASSVLARKLETTESLFHAAMDVIREERARHAKDRSRWQYKFAATTARLERAEAALAKIEALETPKCAHVARGMARIAREGLVEDQARELAA